jgi:acetate kinase
VTALVFSGGVGENAAEIRSRVVAGLEPLGFALDADANRQTPDNVADIGAPHSASRILALRVNEEQEIAGQLLSHLNRR